MTMNVLALSGSLRQASHHTALLRAMAEVAELAGDGTAVQLESLADLPHFNEDLELPAPPASVARLRRLVREADAVVIASPEYNGSVTGVIKDAVDWVSRPRAAAAWAGKPVATLSGSPGDRAGLRGQEALRASLEVVGARLVGPPIALAGIHRRIVEGRPDAALATDLRALLDELQRATAPVELARAS